MVLPSRDPTALDSGLPVGAKEDGVPSRLTVSLIGIMLSDRKDNTRKLFMQIISL